MKTPIRQTNAKRPAFRRAVLPLLVAAVLGTGAVGPALHAAERDAAAAPDIVRPVAPSAPDAKASTGGSGREAGQATSAAADDAATPAADADAKALATAPDAKGDAASPERAGRGDGPQIAAVSEEGLGAMRALHAARLSIFEGATDAAKRQVGEAEKLLKEAKADAKTLREGGEGDANELYVPIEGSLALADAFVPTEAHKPAIEKAGKEMAKKDTAAAIDTLGLAAIDVRYTEVLVPLGRTERHVREARDFLEKGKFHEANLAMLRAERGIVVDTVELAGVPQQG